MYLAGARWYAPDLYRWMSRDPIEYGGGDNMFAYVAGNPVKYHDRSGFVPVKNNSGKDLYYKPENEHNVIQVCSPGETCDADGIYPYDPNVAVQKLRNRLCQQCSVEEDQSIKGCYPFGKVRTTPEFFEQHVDWPDPYSGSGGYPNSLPKKIVPKLQTPPADPAMAWKVGGGIPE